MTTIETHKLKIDYRFCIILYKPLYRIRERQATKPKMRKEILVERLTAKLLMFLAWFFPVCKVNSDNDRKAFTHMWFKIWQQEGYYADPNQDLVGEFSLYNQQSEDFIVKFLGLIPSGTFRFVHQGGLILPVLKDFRVEKTWKTDKVIEATLFTVPKVFRYLFHLPALVLMRHLARYCRNNNLEGALMMVDKRLFYSMKERLGFPLHQVGEERFYEGSVTYPAFLQTEEFYSTMAEVNRFFVS